MRLGKAYVALCEAGDITYLNWKYEIEMNISQVSDISKFLEEAKLMINVLEDSLRLWNIELKDFRKLYPHVNCYSVKQILYLQRQLNKLSVRLENVKDLQPQVYTLLEWIAEGVNSKDVRDAYFVATQLDSDKREEDTDWKRNEHNNFTNFTKEELLSIIDWLVDKQDIDEEVAKASLIKVEPYSKGAARKWCQLQDPDDEDIGQLAEDVDFRLASMLNDGDDDEEEESKNLDSSSFMPLQQFGNFLLRLRMQKSSKSILGRSIPSYLRSDRPNLVYLPKDDIWNMILDLYLTDNTADLPRSQEVLICTSDTPLEQVELLFLRALFNGSDQLYCLAFGDNLKCEVSERSFTYLRHLMHEAAAEKKKYNLVILCTTERKNSSFLASALDCYRVNSPPIDTGCQTKLLSKLKPQQGSVFSASRIDPNGYLVRVVKSKRPGMGKTLYVSSQASALDSECPSVVTVPLHGTRVNIDSLVEAFLEHEESNECTKPRIIHIDVAPVVSSGLDEALFNLIVLKSLMTQTGKVWCRKSKDLYLLEVTEKLRTGQQRPNYGTVIPMFPYLECESPTTVLRYMNNGIPESKTLNPLFNDAEFQNPPIQRVYQYLEKFSANPQSVNTFTFNNNQIHKNQKSCLEILLRFCGVIDPSWLEIRNFVHFFNLQLMKTEESGFCMFDIWNTQGQDDILKGFKTFVVSFMLEMSKDFATRSLEAGEIVEHMEGEDLLLQLKRRWEQHSHPYLFFNEGVDMSFVGFIVDNQMNLYDPERNSILKRNIMPARLYGDLINQGVNLSQNFASWSR